MLCAAWWWWLQRLVNCQMATGCRIEVTTGNKGHQQKMGTGCSWLLKVKGQLLGTPCHRYCIISQASSLSSSAPEPESQSPGYWVLVDSKLPAPNVIPLQKADILLPPLTINPINPPIVNASTQMCTILCQGLLGRRALESRIHSQKRLSENREARYLCIGYH